MRNNQPIIDLVTYYETEIKTIETVQFRDKTVGTAARSNVSPSTYNLINHIEEDYCCGGVI